MSTPCIHNSKSSMKLNDLNGLISYRKIMFAATIAFLGVSCGTDGSGEEQRVKPMVFEGMPANDLEQVLGEPDSISKGGTIYDVAAGEIKELFRWHYKKRTVVVIDDTVKVPNEVKRD